MATKVLPTLVILPLLAFSGCQGLNAVSSAIFGSKSGIALQISKAKDQVASQTLLTDTEIFRTTVYVITRRDCTTCHATQTVPYHASSDLPTAYAAARTKVNFSNIPSSALVQRVKDGHCGSRCSLDGSEMVTAITRWAAAQTPTPPSSPLPTPGMSTVPMPTGTATPMTPSTPAIANPRFSDFKAIIQANCISCHRPGGSGVSAGDFEKLATEADWQVSGMISAGDHLESSIYYRLKGSDGPDATFKNMPIGGRLTDSEIGTIKNYISQMATRQAECSTISPDYIKMRRLNRREYANSVRDLLGIDLNLALSDGSVPLSSFPFDSLDVKGFDTSPDLLRANREFSTAVVNLGEHVADRIQSMANLPSPFSACTVSDQTCIRSALGKFLRRAYRRPAESAELDKLMSLSTTTGGGKNGLASAIFAVLTSEHFIMRVEIDPTFGAVRDLNHYEISARLAHLIWSSVPDDTLLDLASQSRLRDPAIVRTQVQRMLADPRSKAFTDGFGAQLLHLNLLGSAQPNSAAYPGFSESLRQSMKVETLTFFNDLVSNGQSIQRLVDADYTFVNQQLATHYGLSGGFGANTYTRATLPEGSKRRGVFTQGSILLMNSGPLSGSATKRGHWILDRLLCSEPKPAPPNVDTTTAATSSVGLSSRQIMELHATRADCASCHRLMDPIGFSLDYFDGIGKFRAQYMNGSPINPTGTLFQQPFDSPAQMSEIIKSRPELNRCMTKMLYSYAVKLPDSTPQLCSVQNVANQLQGGTGKFEDLITGLVTSPAFQKRRADQP